MNLYTWIPVAALVPVFLLVFFLIRRGGSGKKLDYVDFFIPDADRNYLHLLGFTSYMPEDSPSFSVYAHLLFDVSARQFYSGGTQRGNDLSLDSPFVQRTTEALGSAVGKKLVIDPKLASDRHDFPIVVRNSEETDTQTEEPLPSDCLLITVYPETEYRNSQYFTLGLYRRSQLVQEHKIKGWGDYCLRSVYFPDRNLCCFTYRKGGAMAGGMALCLADVSSGELVFDDFIRAGKRS